MDWLSAIRIGMAGLMVHKFRAALSMLGIIFGVASVVAVIAVSEGARGEVMKQLAAMGANNIMVTGIDWRDGGAESRDLKKKTRLHSDGLTVREAEAASAQCGLFSEYAATRKLNASVRRGEQPVVCEVIGATPSFLKVMGYSLREGRWVVPGDETSRRRVCVIEETIRQQYFPLTSALNESLVIDHEPYEIIGVLAGKEGVSDQKVVDIKKINRRVYIPLASALARTTQEPLSDEVSEVIFSCRSTSDVYTAAELLNRFYEHAHGMSGTPDDQRDYKIRIPLELVKQTENSQKIFNYVMASSAGISLVVGGIGIMNIMLANVTERRREIGTRRAVGATQSDILRQFLFESLSICLLGGILGCLLGVAFTQIVHSTTGWQTSLALWSMLVAIGVSLLDGVVFGTYPAWQAGKLDPIDALRYE